MSLGTESFVNPGLPDSDIRYYPEFLSGKPADELFGKLRISVPWRQDFITIFGKTYMQPRLTALYGTNGKSYTYSGITMEPHAFSPLLTALKRRVESCTATKFTTCLLNLYRDGRDSNGWHADDEKELGVNPVIASVSLGGVRSFCLKHRKNKTLTHKIELQHGSLLLMQGSTQHNWLHQVPKTTRAVGERINLTFRYIP